MCGFVGFIDKKKNKKKIIKDMADIIVHRGPDSDGYYTDDDCALGFRRLSIIDLSGGTQPIYNEDKTMAIIFNGDINSAISERIAERESLSVETTALREQIKGLKSELRMKNRRIKVLEKEITKLEEMKAEKESPKPLEKESSLDIDGDGVVIEEK